MEEEGYSGEIRCVIVGRMRLAERRSRFWQLGDGNREEGEAMRGDIVEESWRVCSWRF